VDLNLPYLYYYLIFAFGLLFLVLAFIPKTGIQKLFWFGLVWGSGSDFIVEHIYCFVHLTKYQHMEPFNVGLLPLWTVLAWTPAIMLFVYTLPQRKEKYLTWIYILMWCIAVTCVAVILKQLDILVFVHGGPWIWFIGGFVFLNLQAKHYRYLQASSKNMD